MESRTINRQVVPSPRCRLKTAWTFALFFSALATVAAASTVAWHSQRGTPECAALCEWTGADPDSQPQPPVEWHFMSKGSRRYTRGLAIWASPAAVIVEGRPMVFIGGCDNTLHALDLQTKRRLWQKITNGPIQDAPVVAEVNGEQVVFWGSSDRFVYAHKAADGKRVWSKEIVPASATLGEVSVASPLFHDGVLYITAFAYDRSLPRNIQTGRLLALDAASGRILWEREVTQGPVNAPSGAVVDGQFTVFTVARRGLVSAWAADAAGASQIWTAQLPHEALASAAVFISDSEATVFVGSKFGNLIAFDARTGREKWKFMTAHWIDNNVCIADVYGTNVVFTGSHDYHLYALRAEDGALLWRRRLGGEIYSAPCFFTHQGRPLVAAAALDNHVYVLDAAGGRVETSFFTGQPIWDKVVKGETLWGSPVAVVAGGEAALVHGSYNGFVFVMPLEGDVSLRAKVQSATALWRGLLVVGGLFLFVLLPLVLLLPERQ